MLLSNKQTPDYRPLNQQPTGLVGRVLDRVVNGQNAGASTLSPASRLQNNGGYGTGVAGQLAQNNAIFSNSSNDALAGYGQSTRLKARALNFLGVHASPDPAVNSILQQGLPGPSGLQTLALGGIAALLGAAGGAALTKGTSTPK